MRINNNIPALNTHRMLNINTNALGKTLEKLSSGKRINRAADDAAGMAISEKMRAQVRGLRQASRNSLDGISLIQTAEGALNEVHEILQRMRELSVQGANGTNAEEDLMAIQNEIDELKESIDNIAKNTDFNGVKPLNMNGSTIEIISPEIDVLVGAGETVNVGVIKIPNPPVPDELWIQGEFGTISGADWPDLNIESPNGEKFGYNEKFLNNQGDTEDTTNKSSDLATYTGWRSEIEKMTFKNPISGEWKIEIRNLGGTETSTFKISSNYPLHVEYIESEEIDNKKKIDLQIGPNAPDRFTINLTDATIKGLELDSISVMTSEDSLKALESIDRAIKKTSSERSKYGAYQNRLEHTIKNLDNTSENLQGAESRIADADMAIEMSKLVKLNILQQTGTLMLSQANHLPQAILQLLK